jgi:tetratricopeptide (TPR) repeat protein
MTEVHGTNPRLGLALIAKNEMRNMPRLLASIEGAFDRVALIDTGSTDETTGLFIHWAKSQAGLTYSVDDFDAGDGPTMDFAAARNAADQLLVYGRVGVTEGEPLVDWTSWADCDDTIRHPEALRQLAADADPNTVAFVMGYEYAYDAQRRVACHLRRERLVRAEYAGSWKGRVHEAQAFAERQMPGMALQAIPDDVCCWEHHKHDDPTPEGQPPSSNDRNLQILKQWALDEPEDPRVVGYLGTELLAKGQVDEAIGWFLSYLRLKTGWDEERAQIHRKLSMAYILSGDYEAADQSALESLRLLPAWPDSYLTLAETCIARQEWEKAAVWAERTQAAGMPTTLLIIQPLDYTFRPRAIRAIAAGEQGQYDEAVALAEEALQYGDEMQLRAGWARWRAQAKREHTANTFIMMAQQLVAHDEQLKALEVLSCVPSFAIDHPGVVALRSWVRERLQWAFSPQAVADYYNDASRPEDFIADENVTPLCEALPRVQFLVAGLRDQLAA